MKQTLKNVGKGALILGMFIAGYSAQAQQVTGDVTKQPSTVLGSIKGDGTGGSVRVIDNKGTIKFLQVKNGITQITNTDVSTGGITTTWQLGGTLTDDTYIDATGKVFAIDGVKLVQATDKASTDAKDGTTHTSADKGSGYTFLVRDEATGETKKLLASQLVTAGHNVEVLTAAGDYTYDLAMSSTIEKISVYRNGAKLVAGTDYTFAGTSVTVKATGGAEATNDDYTLLAKDKIEIHWIN